MRILRPSPTASIPPFNLNSLCYVNADRLTNHAGIRISTKQARPEQEGTTFRVLWRGARASMTDCMSLSRVGRGRGEAVSLRRVADNGRAGRCAVLPRARYADKGREVWSPSHAPPRTKQRVSKAAADGGSEGRVCA